MRTLDNGLRVVVSSTPGLGVVAVNIWYDVGSRHEQPHRQGFAHLFEHLMFQGSRHVESGQHFALLQGAGASLNATTSFDRTNYFESMPAGVLDLALWLEADRMAYLDDVLTDKNFANQVDVVAQERSQRMDNVPYGTVFEQTLPLVFEPSHPYGHLPIGNMEHLGAASLKEVSEFHDRYYMPDNAVLAIVGDVSESDAFAKAEQFFGSIASRGAPPRDLPAPLGPLTSAERLDLVQDVPSPGVWFAARLPADAPTARDLASFDLVRIIVGDGETSRLHRRLVRRDEVALSAGLGVNALVAGNSLGIASVRALPGQDLDGVVDTFTEVITQFCELGPSADELELAKAQAERELLDELSTAAGRADTLAGLTTLFSEPGLVNERLHMLQSVTVEEIHEVAQQWLPAFTNAQTRVTPSAQEPP